MKITKYNQSCLLIEAKEKRILIDPGNTEYTDDMLTDYWTNIDAILITHRHGDHCYTEIINKIIERDNCSLYTSNEVANSENLINPTVVKAGDKLNIGDVLVEVTKSVHGFISLMKPKSEIKENIGFIIDDGNIRLFTPGDTINFNHEYKCDVLCVPFTGAGITLGFIDGIDFIKGINPKLVIPIHLQHKLYNPDLDELKKALTEANIEYKLLDASETIIIN